MYVYVCNSTYPCREVVKFTHYLVTSATCIHNSSKVQLLAENAAESNLFGNKFLRRELCSTQ